MHEAYTNNNGRRKLEVNFSDTHFSAEQQGCQPRLHDCVIIDDVWPDHPDGVIISIARHHLCVGPKITLDGNDISVGHAIIRLTKDTHQLVLCNGGYDGPKFLAVHLDTMKTISASVNMTPDEILSIVPTT